MIEWHSKGGSSKSMKEWVEVRVLRKQEIIEYVLGFAVWNESAICLKIHQLKCEISFMPTFIGSNLKIKHKKQKFLGYFCVLKSPKMEVTKVMSSRVFSLQSTWREI